MQLDSGEPDAKVVRLLSDALLALADARRLDRTSLKLDERLDALNREVATYRTASPADHTVVADPLNRYEMESFGRRLAELRKAAGFTQKQLADEFGVSRRQIAYYETETGHPPASFLIDLARALNVSTDELLGLKAARPLRRRRGQLEEPERKDEEGWVVPRDLPIGLDLESKSGSGVGEEMVFIEQRRPL